MKLYGNLINRLEEGRTVPEIVVGTDITMYLWSDRLCFYVTDVVNQKNIFVKEYNVCADHDKKGGIGHQDWMYFKSRKEAAEYLKKYFPDTDTDVEEYDPREWVFRYNKWQSVDRWTKEKVEAYKEKWGNTPYFTEKELAKLNSGKEVCVYHNLSGSVSFGRRDYYYCWEF